MYAYVLQIHTYNLHIVLLILGIDIQEIQLPKRKIVSNTPTFTFRVWDFAGQEEYYATHQCFLSQRSLYLLIWDTTYKEEGMCSFTFACHSLQY